jgi:hypothetical protein
MGTIIGSKVMDDGKVVYEVVVDGNESLQMKGHVSNIHVFSLNNSDVPSRLTRRGKNDATTYFLVPKELREGLKESALAKCQLVKIPNKKIFIFSLDDF